VFLSIGLCELPRRRVTEDPFRIRRFFIWVQPAVGQGLRKYSFLSTIPSRKISAPSARHTRGEAELHEIRYARKLHR
jgi:hypothetical protein